MMAPSVRALIFCHLLLPSSESGGEASPAPMYLLTRCDWEMGTYSMPLFWYSIAINSRSSPAAFFCFSIPRYLPIPLCRWTTKSPISSLWKEERGTCDASSCFSRKRRYWCVNSLYGRTISRVSTKTKPEARYPSTKELLEAIGENGEEFFFFAPLVNDKRPFVFAAREIGHLFEQLFRFFDLEKMVDCYCWGEKKLPFESVVEKRSRVRFVLEFGMRFGGDEDFHMAGDEFKKTVDRKEKRRFVQSCFHVGKVVFDLEKILEHENWIVKI